MKIHNPDNERIKRAYFTYLAEAQGFSEPTLDTVAKAINRFETYTRFRDFKAFHIEQAKAFKGHLAEQTSHRTKERLSKATLYATLCALKRFFIWLAGQPGYKSRISYSDAEYFNLSTKEARVAKACREERVPTLEQIRHVVGVMPASTEIERRDRALIAFTILTGARDRAIASMKLKHIDIDQGRIMQDARQVNTKFSKTFTTWFFPVDDDILQIIVDWVSYLQQEKLWGATIRYSRQQRSWSALVAISRYPVSIANIGATPAPSGGFSRMRSRLPGCPTSIRTVLGRLAQLGQKRCYTPEQFKAWSQNLGHEKVLTTFASYGEVAAERQRDIIRELAQPMNPNPKVEEILKQLMRATNCPAA